MLKTKVPKCQSIHATLDESGSQAEAGNEMLIFLSRPRMVSQCEVKINAVQIELLTALFTPYELRDNKFDFLKF